MSSKGSILMRCYWISNRMEAAFDKAREEMKMYEDIIMLNTEMDVTAQSKEAIENVIGLY